MERILLGQHGSNGDCLYATTLARQIKTDFPGCHLTWAISSMCRGVIENNSDVDEVWEVPLQSWADMNALWYQFEAEAWAEVARGRFDRAFLTQICPNHFANYDGTIRPSLFRNYPRPITVPVETIINLTDVERERVDGWSRQHRLQSYDHVVIVECSSKSGQSFVTPKLALTMAERVVARNSNVCVILSTHEKFATNHPRILHGGTFGMRETAALTHSASLFVGCGSGLTVVATSNAAKPDLPNIQILSKESSVYASFRHDFEYFGKPSGHFLEMTTSDPEQLAGAMVSVLEDGVSAAKGRYHEELPITFDWYFDLVDLMLLRNRRYLDAAQSLMTTAQRYGWRDDLLGFGARAIWPNVQTDAGARFPRGAETIEKFGNELRARLGEQNLPAAAPAASAGLAVTAVTAPSQSASAQVGAVSRRFAHFRHTVGRELRARWPNMFRAVARVERMALRLFR